MSRVLSCLICVAMAATGPAHAQPAAPAPEQTPSNVANAEVLMKRGIELAAAGDHEGALAAFKQAAELVPDANVPHKLAAEQLEALGRYFEAIAEYRLYIAIRPDAKGVTDARARIQQLEQEHIGSLVIACKQAGALVDVDGTVVGTTPLAPLPRLAPATATVTISATGFKQHRETVALTPGTRTTVECALEREVDQPPTPPPSSSRPTPRDESPPWYRRWVVMGPAIGVAAALVGVGLYVAFSDGVPDTDGGSHTFP
jgi:hypothetical protein